MLDRLNRLIREQGLSLNRPDSIRLSRPVYEAVLQQLNEGQEIVGDVGMWRRLAAHDGAFADVEVDHASGVMSGSFGQPVFQPSRTVTYGLPGSKHELLKDFALGRVATSDQ